MKKLYSIIFCLLAALLTNGQSMIIENVNVISMTSDKVDTARSVLIEDGIIKEIAPFDGLSRRKGIKVINAKGKYLMPGFADMHVHLPEAKEVDRLLKMSVAAGITHMRVMNNDYPQLALKKDIKKGIHSITPHLYYSYLIKRSLKQASLAQMDSIIASAKSQGIDFIKLFSIANEEIFDHVMKATQKNDIIVCGHYPRYVQDRQWKFLDIEKVLKSNLRSIEHLGGYASMQDENKLLAAIKLTKQLGIYNCPTIDWGVMAFDIQYPHDVNYRLTYRVLPKKITESWPLEYAAYVKKVGKEKLLEKRSKRLPYFEKKKKILKALYKNDCLLLVGSDGERAYQAPGFNLWEEMKNWSDIGIDNYTILKSATINAATFFKEEDSWGTIEIGKRADLILLDKNPIKDIENVASILSTFIGGRQYHKRDFLDS